MRPSGFWNSATAPSVYMSKHDKARSLPRTQRNGEFTYSAYSPGPRGRFDEYVPSQAAESRFESESNPTSTW
ncbi:hypothetical protein RRF57_011677 [Xylaria bambusicola]|uniref:Uncharacterized protein n=1 Tax=Xylaria bambusicola TaxID=326684 RepID=A0AAN7UN94_9PEZI